MKTIIVFLVSVLIYTTTSFSQEKDADNSLKLKSVTAQSGQGAITSGLYVSTSVGNDKVDFDAFFSQNDLYFSYRWKLFDGLVSVGPSGGYFYNTVWIGPQMFMSFGKHISTLHWLTYSAGEIKFDGSAKTDLAKWRRMAVVNGVYLNTADWFGGTSFGVGYTSINWLKESPKKIVGFKFSQIFGKDNNWIYSTDISYEARDGNMLYQLSLTRNF